MQFPNEYQQPPFQKQAMQNNYHQSQSFQNQPQMMKSTALPITKPKIPSEIKIGIETGIQNTFDDYQILTKKPFPHVIRQISVQFNKERICAIRFDYMDGKNQDVSGNSIRNSSLFTSTHEETFRIQNGDYIMVIYGTVEKNQINSIGFVTYSGRSAIFGIEKGIKFNHLYYGFTFTCCKGSYSKNQLNSLEFQVVKLPFDYIAQNIPEILMLLYPNNTQQQDINNQQMIQPVQLPQPQQQQINYLSQQQPSVGYQQPQQYILASTPLPPPPPPQYQYPPQQQQVIYVQQSPYTQQQSYYNQQQQKSGMGTGTAMAIGAVGTIAAIQTVNMMTNNHHHQRHHHHHHH